MDWVAPIATTLSGLCSIATLSVFVFRAGGNTASVGARLSAVEADIAGLKASQATDRSATSASIRSLEERIDRVESSVGKRVEDGIREVKELVSAYTRAQSRVLERIEERLGGVELKAAVLDDRDLRTPMAAPSPLIARVPPAGSHVRDDYVDPDVRRRDPRGK